MTAAVPDEELQALQERFASGAQAHREEEWDVSGGLEPAALTMMKLKMPADSERLEVACDGSADHAAGYCAGLPDIRDKGAGVNGEESLTVPRGMLQKVFDTAVHSLDFGSGHLDDDEVTALRAVAVLLGADPAIATPENFRCKYAGQHQGGRVDWAGQGWMCTQCHGPWGEPPGKPPW
jgi:hypothetical protein